MKLKKPWVLVNFQQDMSGVTEIIGACPILSGAVLVTWYVDYEGDWQVRSACDEAGNDLENNIWQRPPRTPPIEE